MLQNKTDRKIGSIYSRHSSAPKNSHSNTRLDNITEISKNIFTSTNQSLQYEIAILSEKQSLTEKKHFGNILLQNDNKRDGKIYTSKSKQFYSECKENMVIDKQYSRERNGNNYEEPRIGKICKMQKERININKILSMKEDNSNDFMTSRYRCNKPLNFAYTHEGYNEFNSAVQKKFNYKRQDQPQQKTSKDINKSNGSSIYQKYQKFIPISQNSKISEKQEKSIPLANFCKFTETMQSNSFKHKQNPDIKYKSKDSSNLNNFISTYRQQFERQHFPQQHQTKKSIINLTTNQPTKNQKIKIFEQKYHEIVQSYEKKKVELDKKIELHEQESQFMLTVIANRKNNIMQLQEKEEKVMNRHTSLSMHNKQMKNCQEVNEKNQNKNHDKAILELLQRSKNMKKAIQQLQQKPKQTVVNQSPTIPLSQEQLFKPWTQVKKQYEKRIKSPQKISKSPVVPKSPHIIRKGILQSRLQRSAHSNHTLSPLKLTRCTPDTKNLNKKMESNKEIFQKFVIEIEKQIKLDQRLRAVREQIQNHKKVNEIRSALALQGISKDEIALQFEEYDPYYSDNSAQLDQEKLTLNYILARKQCQDHWRDKLQQKWDQNSMKQFFQQLDFNKSGCITLKDLMRQINCLTKKNYRVRDLFKIHQKLKPITLDNFLRKLGKLEQ